MIDTSACSLRTPLAIAAICLAVLATSAQADRDKFSPYDETKDNSLFDPPVDPASPALDPTFMATFGDRPNIDPSKNTMLVANYVPDEELQKQFNANANFSYYKEAAGLFADAGISARTSQFQYQGFYSWTMIGLANFDYKTAGYRVPPSKRMQGKRPAFCHLDVGGRNRPVGLTFPEGTGNNVYKTCYYVRKDFDNGGTVSVGEESRFGLWSVMNDYKLPGKASSAYTWKSASWVREQCHLALRQNQPTVCPAVVGNYGETASTIGFQPGRFICRHRRGPDFFYGWTDTHIGPKSDDNCYMWRFVDRNGQQVREPFVVSTGYLILTWPDYTTTDLSMVYPFHETCGDKCRAHRNYPYAQSGHFPGIAGQDIAEGVFVITFNAASCCALCRQTPGCNAWFYTGRAQHWCWIKYGECWNQRQPRTERVCFTAPPADRSQCEARPNAGGYGAVLAPQDRARQDVSAAGTCNPRSVHPTMNTGHCGIALVVHAPTLEQCCNACRAFNRVLPSGRRPCVGFTWFRIKNDCFLRDRPDCSPNNKDHWWFEGSPISGFL